MAGPYLIQEAVLIVVRVGNTPGVLWELDQIISLGQLSRTVILLSESTEVTNAVVDRLHTAGNSVEAYEGKKNATPPILIAHDGVGFSIKTSRGYGLPAAITSAVAVLGVPVSGRSAQPKDWRRFEVILKKAFKCRGDGTVVRSYSTGALRCVWL